MRRGCAAILLMSLVVAARADEIGLKVLDIDSRREFFGATQYDDVAEKLGDVKVAVMGRGFKGIWPKDEGERYLPESAELITEYKTLKKTAPLDATEEHDMLVAHMVWAMAGYRESGPKFRLYNANGEDNFVEAVKAAIKWGAHIIVCSLNWETFGNFDGSGFLNTWIQEAVDEGVIWLNAAGNYGGLVANSKVSVVKHEAGEGDKKEVSEWLKFRNGSSYFMRFKNNVDENRLTITLSWNAFSAGADRPGTDQDLDLYLYAEATAGKEDGGKPIKVASLKQVKGTPKDNTETKDAYERMVVTLPALSKGRHYLLAVNKKGGTFNEKSLIRITMSGTKQAFRDSKGKRIEAIEFVDATNDGEIPTLADGAGLTIGNLAKISAKGPTRAGIGKPEIISEKENVTFTDRVGFVGTSYSVGDIGGLAALMKAKEPGLRQHHMEKFRGALPKRFYEGLGWDFSKTYRLAQSPKLWDLVYQAELENFAVMDGADGTMWVGSMKDPTKLADLRDLPKTVRDNFDDYSVYFYEHREETTQQVKEPDRTVKDPDYEVIVRPAEYYWEYETESASNGYVTLTLYTPVLKKRPAKTQMMTGRTYTIPGAVRTVPGEPKITLKTWYAKTSDEKVPWKENGGMPAQYTRIVHLKQPAVLGKGILVDGSEKTPRVWRTPTPGALKAAVRAK